MGEMSIKHSLVKVLSTFKQLALYVKQMGFANFF